METVKYKHRILISQTFSTEVEVESYNSELNTHEDVKRALSQNNIKIIDDVMTYYDKYKPDGSVFSAKDWTKDEEVMLPITSESFIKDYKL